MKSFKAETQEPLKRANVRDHCMSKDCTSVIVRGVTAVFFPRLVSRKLRVVQ
jgi:hypothetical protein